MKSILKIAASSLLLSAVSIPLAFTIYFDVKQKLVQLEMKEKLEQCSLHIITIPENEINWKDPGKEIMADGKLFDVKSYSLQNGFYYLKGLFDEEETALVKKMENTTKQNDDPGRLLVQLFQIMQTVSPDNNYNDSVADNFKDYNLNLIIPSIISRAKDILTPPPQTI